MKLLPTFRLRPGLADLRYAARSVARAKTFTAILLVCLGLGTGANAVVLGAVRALLFDPPPGVEQPGSLLLVHTMEFSGARYGDSSFPDFESMQGAASSVFESLAAIEDRGQVVVEHVPARVAAVSGDYFRTLRMQPRRGRLFEAIAGAATPPAVISSYLWTELGARDDIEGSRIEIAGRAYVVSGVAAEGFRGIRAVRPTDVWIPFDDEIHGSARGDRRLKIVGRLRAGVDVQDAERVLGSMGARLAEEFPDTNRGTINAAEEPRLFFARPYSRLEPQARSAAILIATVVMSAVALLLVSACVTAGGLLLARGTARRRELAVKMALGAPRDRLVRQLLAESLLVAAGGGAAGLLFAVWAGSAIRALFPPEHAAMLDAGPDAGLVLLTVGIASAAGVVFGIVPAFHATGAGAIAALRADSGEIADARGATGLRRALIVAQIAVSTMLVAGAGLLADSLDGALAGDLGFAARQVAIFGGDLPGGRGGPVAALSFDESLGVRLREIEGVAEVGWASAAPLASATTARFRVEAGVTGVTDTMDFATTVVSPGYFSAMGMQFVEGRPFDENDRTRSTPAAIVDDLLARRHFGPAAVGHHLIDDAGRRLLVVGVVRSGRYRTLQDAPRPTVYRPLAQAYTPRGYLFVRTAGDPGPMLDALAGTLREWYGGMEIKSAALDDHLADALAIDRLTTTLVGVCGLLALVMAAIGAYGVMGDAVRRRTREIGLRVALGAGRPDVVRLVCAEVAALTAIGGAAGVAATFIAVRAGRSLVFGLAGPDVVTLTATPALLSLVLAAAAIVPLRRALRVSPTVALRAE